MYDPQDIIVDADLFELMEREYHQRRLEAARKAGRRLLAHKRVFSVNPDLAVSAGPKGAPVRPKKRPA